MHSLLVPLMIIGVLSVASAQHSLNSKLGLMQPFGDRGACVLTHDWQLKRGQRISVIDFDEYRGRQKILSAVVGKRLTSGCDDIGGENSSRAYELTLKADAPLGIAIFSKVTLKQSGRSVSGDLNGDGRSERFRICWSSEGAHLTVWSGVPLKSKRLWHTYYYAGYDTQANCTEKEARE